LSDLSELFKVIAEGKADYKKNDHVGKTVQKVQENLNVDLSSLLSELSETKKNDPIQKRVKKVKKDVKNDLVSLFEQLSGLNKELTALEELKEESLIAHVEQIEPVKSIEEPKVITEVSPIPAEPVIKSPEERIKDTQDDVKKYLKDKSFQQPTPDVVDRNIDDIRKKIRFLEQSIGRIAATGPGGGEVNLKYLDDIDRASIADGKYLKYNNTTGKFEFDQISATIGEDFIIDGEEY